MNYLRKFLVVNIQHLHHIGMIFLNQITLIDMIFQLNVAKSIKYLVKKRTNLDTL